mmetsp:Transcript_98355/g.262866  ORF Transcript_98355/g.262866 Transcript_98355/m.262866 type:complete len:254 (+) Transcript_98355:1026-1787(+)
MPSLETPLPSNWPSKSSTGTTSNSRPFVPTGDIPWAVPQSPPRHQCPRAESNASTDVLVSGPGPLFFSYCRCPQWSRTVGQYKPVVAGNRDSLVWKGSTTVGAPPDMQQVYRNRPQPPESECSYWKPPKMSSPGHANPILSSARIPSPAVSTCAEYPGTHVPSPEITAHSYFTSVGVNSRSTRACPGPHSMMTAASSWAQRLPRTWTWRKLVGRATFMWKWSEGSSFPSMSTAQMCQSPEFLRISSESKIAPE